MIKVLSVISSLGAGGAESYLLETVQRLDRRRFEPVVACLYSGPLAPRFAAVTRLHENLRRSPSDLGGLARLARLIEREKPDILHTIDDGSDASVWAKLAELFAPVRVTVTESHWLVADGRPAMDAFYLMIDRLLQPRTDALIAIGEAAGATLARRLHARSEKVHVIHNGVDVERFAPRSGIAHLRARLGLPQDARVVGTVAGFRPIKAHDILLQAAATVVAAQPDTHFLLAGDGPTRREMEALTKKLGLQHWVHFLGHREDIPDLLAALDLFVLPSHAETFPLCVLEAMAAGRPVIATDVGSTREAVVEGVTGRLVRRRSSCDLAAALLDLLGRPREMKAMGKAGRQRVLAKFTIQESISRREALFAALLGEAR